MSPSRPFIVRPVATTLLMLAIVIVGVLAYKLLAVSALPEVDYPTIQVVTFYPGASPDVTSSAITATVTNGTFTLSTTQPSVTFTSGATSGNQDTVNVLGTGYLGTVAIVERKDIKQAVTDFLLAATPRTKAAEGQRAPAWAWT